MIIGKVSDSCYCFILLGVDPLIVPSISIDFSTLSITEAKTESKPIKPEPFLPALPAASTALDSRTFGSDISNTNQSTVNFGVRGDSMRPGNGSGDSKPAQVKMEKDIRSASAITKFLSRGGSTGMVEKSLCITRLCLLITCLSNGNVCWELH